jgi:hypothetical protein
VDEHLAAVALLLGTEPTDRALMGWHDRVWIALGANAMFAKPYQPLARWLPCGYTMRWYDETPPRAARQDGQTRTTSS